MDSFWSAPSHTKIDSFENTLNADLEKLSEKVGRKIEKQWPFRGRLHGVGAQYRGTLISGRRAHKDFYHVGGTKDASKRLTDVYFDVFDIADTIGEVFHDFVLSGDARHTWHVLVLELSATCDLLDYEFKPYSGVGMHCLRFSSELANRLWPSPQIALAKAAFEVDNFENAGDAIAKLKLWLPYYCYRVAPSVLPTFEEGADRAFEAFRGFTSGTDQPTSLGPDDMRRRDLPRIRRLLRAIQAFSLYNLEFVPEHARSSAVIIAAPSERHDAPDGSGPNNGEQVLSFLAPRVGIAAWLRSSQFSLADRMSTPDGRTFAEAVVDVLVKDVLPEMNSGLATMGRTLESLLTPPTQLPAVAQDWSPVAEKIITLLKVNREIASFLAKRLLTMADQIVATAPSAQHEGEPIPLVWLLGRDYHDQVSGQPTEDAKKLPDRLAEAYNKSVKFPEGNSVGREHASKDLVELLTKSLATVLDWPGTLMFFSLDASTYHLTSIRRLPNVASHDEVPTRISTLTREKPGLFAFVYQPHAGIKLYCLGNPIARHSHGRWVAASAKDDLDTLVASLFCRVSQSEWTGCPKLRAEIGPFCRIIERISETPGNGAMFVFYCRDGGPDSRQWNGGMGFPAGALAFEGRISMPSLASEFDDHEMFYRMCISDGATVVEFGRGFSDLEIWRRSHILFRRKIDSKFDLQRAVDAGLCDHKKAVGLSRLGTRRLSALALASNFAGQLGVITVSADGPVTFYFGRAPGSGSAMMEEWP